MAGGVDVAWRGRPVAFGGRCVGDDRGLPGVAGAYPDRWKAGQRQLVSGGGRGCLYLHCLAGCTIHYTDGNTETYKRLVLLSAPLLHSPTRHQRTAAGKNLQSLDPTGPLLTRMKRRGKVFRHPGDCFPAAGMLPRPGAILTAGQYQLLKQEALKPPLAPLSLSLPHPQLISRSTSKHRFKSGHFSLAPPPLP